MEYWGRAWADYCDISYIASSASAISALLVYSVQVYTHKQHAGTVASSVSRLRRYEHHKTAEQSAHRSFLIHTGALVRWPAATVPLSQ